MPPTRNICHNSHRKSDDTKLQKEKKQLRIMKGKNKMFGEAELNQLGKNK